MASAEMVDAEPPSIAVTVPTSLHIESQPLDDDESEWEYEYSNTETEVC
jgi:hypothetical protein